MGPIKNPKFKDLGPGFLQAAMATVPAAAGVMLAFIWASVALNHMMAGVSWEIKLASVLLVVTIITSMFSVLFAISATRREEDPVTDTTTNIFLLVAWTSFVFGGALVPLWIILGS